MKSILISIRPEWVAKILNGEKTLEFRKNAPKCDLPIDGYIYCTEPNAKETLSLFTKEAREHYGRVAEFIERKRVDNPNMRWSICNGKVIAKFTLRYCFTFTPDLSFYDSGLKEVLLKASCLSEEQIKAYADGAEFLKAWEISDLVIFDEPKKLSDFGLKRAPQSWQYVEVLE